MKTFRIPALSLVALLVLPVASAQAGPQDRYSLIHVENKTSVRVYYSYRWGDGSNEYTNSLAPGKGWIHWWEFDYAGQDYAPWFYIQPEGKSGWYKCRSFYAPNTDKKHAKEYIFDWNESRDAIELYIKLYKE